jgi:hypothetical protein
LLFRVEFRNICWCRKLHATRMAARYYLRNIFIIAL